MSKEHLKQQISKLDDFIQSRQEWLNLQSHESWPKLVNALNLLRAKALNDLGVAKPDELRDSQNFYQAICAVYEVISTNCSMEDLQVALLEKEVTIDELKALDEAEQLERAPIYSGGAV